MRTMGHRDTTGHDTTPLPKPPPVASRRDPLSRIDPLVGWLVVRFPDVDLHVCQEAAHEAALAVLPRQDAFDHPRKLIRYMQRVAYHHVCAVLLHEQAQASLPTRVATFGPHTAPDTLRVVLGREAVREAFAARVPRVLYTRFTRTELWILELILLRVSLMDAAAWCLGVQDLPLADRRAAVATAKHAVRKRWSYAYYVARGATPKESVVLMRRRPYFTASPRTCDVGSGKTIETDRPAQGISL